jgi:hypothetical protein
MVLNPYFPHNLQLLVEHMQIKLTMSDFDTKVGSEWYPYDSWEFLGNSAVACIAMLAGYISFELSERKRAHCTIFFLLFSTALMIMTARWKRIAEYWPPFAVLFAAFSLQPWLQGLHPYPRRLPPDVLEELQPFFDREEKTERASLELLRHGAAAVVALVLCVFLYFNLTATEKEIAQSEPHDHYRAGAQWLRDNVPAGQIIFNTDWDDFPRLFYYAPSHHYVSGLDPNYLFDKDPDLSRLYDRITLGQEQDPGPLIRDRFGARYVFSDNLHHDFFDQARSSGWFDIVYEDTECTIMYIRDEKLVENPLGEPGDE